MTWASCWLSSRSGVGGAALAVECPLEAFKQVGVAQALDGGDAAAAGIGDFVIRPSVFVREFQPDFANLAMYFTPVIEKRPQYVDLDICTSRQLIWAHSRSLATGCSLHLRERGGIDRNRLLQQAPKQLAARPGSPAIEAKREFV